MDRLFIAFGALFMFLSVVAGSFGAHGLKEYFKEFPYYGEVFGKAALYQMIHGLGLFVVAWLASRGPSQLIPWAGFLFIGGIFLFSGSLFVLSLTKIKWLGAITPLGGLAFLIGWICIFISSVK